MVLSKLGWLLAVMCGATLLAGGGLAGFLVQAGHLTWPRYELIVQVLRGERDDLLVEEEETAANEPDPLEEPVPEGSSIEAIRERLSKERLLNAQVEHQVDVMEHQQQLLQAALMELVNSEEQFGAKVDRWQRERAQLDAQDREAGFRQELEYVQNLAPDQAKEHLIRTWEKHRADAVRLMRALPVNKGKRILAELKTEAELEILHELLEQFRLQDYGLDKNTPRSGRTPGDVANR